MTISQHWQWDSVPVSSVSIATCTGAKAGDAGQRAQYRYYCKCGRPTADVHSHSVALIDVCTGLAVTNMIYDSRGTPILSFVFLVLIEFSQSPLVVPSGLIRFTCYNALPRVAV